MSGDGQDWKAAFPTPTWEAEDVLLYHADCLDVLPQMKAGSVDVVVTDPPCKVTQTSLTLPIDMGVAPTVNPSRNVNTSVFRPMDMAIIPESERIAADYLFLVGWRDMPALLSAVTHLRGIMVFHRTNPAPTVFAPHPQNAAFIVWFANKSALYGRRVWSTSVFSYSAPTAGCIRTNERVLIEGTQQAAHPSQQPLILFREIVAPLGAVICDPYLGTGTTGVAAIETGKRFIGIEIDDGYFAIAVKRIEKAIREEAGKFAFARAKREPEPMLPFGPITCAT